MTDTPDPIRTRLLPAARDLAIRLGVDAGRNTACVRLGQVGRMLRKPGGAAWMNFTANQTIATHTCAFAWRARFGPFGMISVCDALDEGGARLDVDALGFIPLARASNSTALRRGETMRYLAELAWAPDAILLNSCLRWRQDAPDRLSVSAGLGDEAAEVLLDLDRDGRIATAFAPDRPRSPTAPFLPTPWRGRFFDYRFHRGYWLPFAGEVAWQIDGRQEIYWQGRLVRWDVQHGHP